MKLFNMFIIPSILASVILPPTQPPIEIIAGCGTDFLSQTSSFVRLQPDNRNVFARAGRSEDAQRAKLYFQELNESNNAACQLVGDTTISADSWMPIGQLPAGDKIGTLFLTIDTQESTQAGASQPSIILASDIPPCDLKRFCGVTYKGSAFELSPKKLSLGSDTLRTGVLSSPINDSIKKVIYSVDGKQVYTSKKLEPFNERYVAGGEHSLERTVVLASGQSLGDKRTITKGTFGDPGYWFTSTYTRYSRLLLILGVLLGSFLLGLTWLQTARFFYKRKMWKVTHIAPELPEIGQNVAHTIPPHKFDGSIPEVFREHKRLFFAPFAALLIIILTFTYVLSMFTVDGISMEPTLHDTTKHPLYIAPAQLGKLNGNGYLPERGTIVVVQKDESNLFDASADLQKSYVVKRVVALPEERVVISGGIIRVFNNEYREGFVPDDKFNWIKDTTGSEYIKLDITLKQNEVFVVGDNRDNSIDSRYYGPIQASQVIGKVL